MAKSNAVITRDDGTPDFHALRSQHRGHEAVLVAFDLIERDGEDLRDQVAGEGAVSPQVTSLGPPARVLINWR